MTQTRNPFPSSLPSRVAIEKTLAESRYCSEDFRGQKCGKPIISHDVEFSSGCWVVFCTCEEGHVKRVPIEKKNKMSFIGSLEESYAVTTPRELLFDGDGPPFYEHPATSLKNAREKASKLTDAKILLTERVTIEGFSGIVSRSREIT